MLQMKFAKYLNAVFSGAQLAGTALSIFLYDEVLVAFVKAGLATEIPGCQVVHRVLLQCGLAGSLLHD